MRVLVLGAGFGGLELSTRLSEELGDDADVVLIDQSDHFIMGFSKLDVMFGRTSAEAVRHAYADVVKPGVRFVQSVIRSIDPDRRSVETDAGHFEGDVLVVALGADLDPSATPGLVEAGYEFYTPAGAFAAAKVLDSFSGGRVIVGVTSTPFKCPPAPSETALMLHDFLVERGVREQSEISLVMPLGSPIPPSPAASEALLAAFAERGISWSPGSLVRSLDQERQVAVLADGRELPFDLFLAVPTHRVPDVVAESGMCVDGWIPVNPLTLETSYPGVYAVGDVTSVGTPKAGVFSERQAGVVAERLIDQQTNRAGTVANAGAEANAGADAAAETVGATYDGTGLCFIEFGDDRIGRVEVTFRSGEPPVGTFHEPTRELRAKKADFGASRAKRWFGRDWANH